MRMQDRMLARDLWHMRGQAAAAALVVACGVMAFLSMRATYESLRAARDDYYAVCRFPDLFASLERAPAHLAARIAEIPGVAEVRSRIVVEVTLDVPGLDEPATGRLVSVPDRRRMMLNDLVLRSGRYLEPGREDEALISEAFAVANQLKPGDELGAVINDRWRRLRIVGVALSPEYIYEVGRGSIFPDNRRFGVLWLGETALASAYDMKGAFNDLVIRLSAGADPATVIERLDRLLAPYGSLGAYGREDQLSHRFISDEIAQNRITSTFVPGIFLGVAAFLLHVILSRLITLQRSQIGALKAFGYSDGDVGFHYLKLALMTVAAGSLLGIAAGVLAGRGLTDLYRDYYRFPSLSFTVGPRVLFLTLLTAGAAAALGALGAARGAARLPLAVAMRPAPPADFRPGRLDRAGVTSVLPSSARMILRNILRRPWNSTLTVAGLASAVAILVVGRFGLDAMTHMMRVQFEVVQRADVTVIFNSPEPGRVRHELAGLPGVLAVEPFRTIPVRLRNGHRTKRVEITGLSGSARLRRLVDDQLRPVPLPDQGLLLTRKLGELLRVAPGQTLEAEILEGERPRLELTVVALVDEPVGIGGYLDLTTLNALLQEGNTRSGAYLAVDPLRAPALHRELKRRPGIAGVALRDVVVDSMNQILDRSMRRVTLIEIFLACVIAGGIVYNGTRIALSERGNELASLRVLGFTRGEVTALLLGEQAALTLLAIPVGLALGATVCRLLVAVLDTELYRIPFVFRAATTSFSVLVIAVAALLSGLVVARRIGRLDLVAVLKTRE